MSICGITGSTGLIGKQILKNKICKKFVKFKGNIKNKSAVNNWVKNKKFDTIMHLASFCLEANKNFKEAKKINYTGTKHLRRLIKYKPKLKWFFFFYSACLCTQKQRHINK